MTDALDQELAQWRAAGRTADFWWRDDDAVAPMPALDQLLALGRRYQAPLTLAVIPAALDFALADRLAGEPVAVVQHGWSHQNHVQPGAKKMELGPERPVAEVAADLAVGRARLLSAFGSRFLPVLVPPWNRIAPSVVATLPRLGFSGLSTAKPRAARWAAPGLVQVNSHVDPILWHDGKRPMDDAAVAAAITDQLALRRHGGADPNEPIGLLTHHLVHGAAMWHCLEQLLARLQGRVEIRWVTGGDVFAV